VNLTSADAAEARWRRVLQYRSAGRDRTCVEILAISSAHALSSQIVLGATVCLLPLKDLAVVPSGLLFIVLAIFGCKSKV
jgi:uncharacterized membrane protein